MSEYKSSNYSLSKNPIHQSQRQQTQNSNSILSHYTNNSKNQIFRKEGETYRKLTPRQIQSYSNLNDADNNLIKLPKDGYIPVNEVNSFIPIGSQIINNIPRKKFSNNVSLNRLNLSRNNNPVNDSNYSERKKRRNNWKILKYGIYMIQLFHSIKTFSSYSKQIKNNKFITVQALKQNLIDIRTFLLPSMANLESFCYENFKNYIIYDTDDKEKYKKSIFLIKSFIHQFFADLTGSFAKKTDIPSKIKKIFRTYILEGSKLPYGLLTTFEFNRLEFDTKIKLRNMNIQRQSLLVGMIILERILLIDVLRNYHIYFPKLNYGNNKQNNINSRTTSNDLNKNLNLNDNEISQSFSSSNIGNVTQEQVNKMRKDLSPKKKLKLKKTVPPSNPPKKSSKNLKNEFDDVEEDSIEDEMLKTKTQKLATSVIQYRKVQNDNEQQNTKYTFKNPNVVRLSRKQGNNDDYKKKKSDKSKKKKKKKSNDDDFEDENDNYSEEEEEEELSKKRKKKKKKKKSKNEEEEFEDDDYEKSESPKKKKKSKGRNYDDENDYDNDNNYYDDEYNNDDYDYIPVKKNNKKINDDDDDEDYDYDDYDDNQFKTLPRNNKKKNTQNSPYYSNYNDGIKPKKKSSVVFSSMDHNEGEGNYIYHRNLKPKKSSLKNPNDFSNSPKYRNNNFALNNPNENDIYGDLGPNSNYQANLLKNNSPHYYRERNMDDAYLYKYLSGNDEDIFSKIKSRKNNQFWGDNSNNNNNEENHIPRVMLFNNDNNNNNNYEYNNSSEDIVFIQQNLTHNFNFIINILHYIFRKAFEENVPIYHEDFKEKFVYNILVHKNIKEIYNPKNDDIELIQGILIEPEQVNGFIKDNQRWLQLYKYAAYQFSSDFARKCLEN